VVLDVASSNLVAHPQKQEYQMTELETLTQHMGEQEARAVRLGYALGLCHGRYAAGCDLPGGPPVFSGPEFRVLKDLGLGELG
jgi:hypothetical protein